MTLTKRTAVQSSNRDMNRKKHCCDVCKRRFFTRKDVKRHQVVHTGSRQFVCCWCQHAFGRKDHLVRHEKKIHPQLVKNVLAPVVINEQLTVGILIPISEGIRSLLNPTLIFSAPGSPSDVTVPDNSIPATHSSSPGPNPAFSDQTTDKNEPVQSTDRIWSSSLDLELNTQTLKDTGTVKGTPSEPEISSGSSSSFGSGSGSIADPNEFLESLDFFDDLFLSDEKTDLNILDCFNYLDPNP